MISEHPSAAVGILWIAYRIRLQTSLKWVAFGSFATAAATGALVGQPELWLAEALGLALWVLLPGIIGLRSASKLPHV
jgi:2-methylcitrate dehydratase PrpD